MLQFQFCVEFGYIHCLFENFQYLIVEVLTLYGEKYSIWFVILMEKIVSCFKSFRSFKISSHGCLPWLYAHIILLHLQHKYRCRLLLGFNVLCFCIKWIMCSCQPQAVGMNFSRLGVDHYFFFFFITLVQPHLPFAKIFLYNFFRTTVNFWCR